jgi:hypothetical protein
MRVGINGAPLPCVQRLSSRDLPLWVVRLVPPGESTCLRPGLMIPDVARREIAPDRLPVQPAPTLAPLLHLDPAGFAFCALRHGNTTPFFPGHLLGFSALRAAPKGRTSERGAAQNSGIHHASESAGSIEDRFERSSPCLANSADGRLKSVVTALAMLPFLSADIRASKAGAAVRGKRFTLHFGRTASLRRAVASSGSA